MVCKINLPSGAQAPPCGAASRDRLFLGSVAFRGIRAAEQVADPGGGRRSTFDTRRSANSACARARANYLRAVIRRRSAARPVAASRPPFRVRALGEKKAGTFRSRRVEQGGFTSGRRRTPKTVKSWGPFPGLAPGTRPGGTRERNDLTNLNPFAAPDQEPTLDRWTSSARFSSNPALRAAARAAQQRIPAVNRPSLGGYHTEGGKGVMRHWHGSDGVSRVPRIPIRRCA